VAREVCSERIVRNRDGPLNLIKQCAAGRHGRVVRSIRTKSLDRLLCEPEAILQFLHQEVPGIDVCGGLLSVCPGIDDFRDLMEGIVELNQGRRI